MKNKKWKMEKSQYIPAFDAVITAKNKIREIIVKILSLFSPVSFLYTRQAKLQTFRNSRLTVKKKIGACLWKWRYDALKYRIWCFYSLFLDIVRVALSFAYFSKHKTKHKIILMFYLFVEHKLWADKKKNDKFFK